MPTTSLADLRTGALVELISSSEIAPGAGAAGAVTLALGAACGAKAVSVSLKHAPEDTRLSLALAGFEKLRGCSLQGADRDSQAFTDFVRHRNAAGAKELVQTGEAMAHLIDALFLMIEEIEPHVRPSMTGDLIAARALATAARTIQSANEAEAREIFSQDVSPA
jgi:formiminotetrahydrofolate cyclodeaminase